MFENRIQKLIYYRVPKVYYVDFIVHPIPPSNTLAPIPFQVSMSS